MRLQVNTDEMELLTKKIDDNAINLYKEIMSCLKDVEKIGSAYQSIESDYILNKTAAYLERLKAIPFTYNELNKITKKANRIYNNKDLELALEVQKESSVDYDEEDVY